MSVRLHLKIRVAARAVGNSHFGGLVGYSANAYQLTDRLRLVLDPRTIRKYDLQFEETPRPDRVIFARDAAFPSLQVHDTLRIAHRLCEEAEGMIAPPLLPTASDQYGSMQISPCIPLTSLRRACLCKATWLKICAAGAPRRGMWIAVWSVSVRESG